MNQLLLADLANARRGAKRDLAAFNPMARGGRAFPSTSPAGINAVAPRSVIPFSAQWPNVDINDHVGEAESDVNPRIKPFGRRYMAFESNGIPLTPPGAMQWAIVQRNVQRSPNITFDSQDTMTPYALTIPGEPLYAVTPLHFNFLIANLQWELYNKDPEAYRNLTPRDIWWGSNLRNTRQQSPFMPEIVAQYDGFAWDTVVEIERGDSGAATQHTEGYMATSDGHVMGMADGASKSVTGSQCGQVHCVDYWGGYGMTGNAKLYAVLTKGCEPATKKGQETSFSIKYALGQKGVDSLRGTMDVVLDSRAVNIAPDGAPDEEVGFNPFQLCFVTEPSGGNLSQAYAGYRTEWDDDRRDGLIMRLGSCMFPPEGSQQIYKPPPLPGKLKPLRSGVWAMSSRPLVTIANPDNGLFNTIN